MTDQPDLLALLGSRICHDLISPIGAIGNGVELLMMEPGGVSPEVALIADSVTHANARIRFFRVGFGVAAGDQRIGRAEVVAILADLTQGGRLAIDWASAADLPRAEVKLAFLLLMCLESALPFGGHVMVDHDGGRWQIVALAPRMKLDPDLWEVLSNPTSGAAITPSQVHFTLAAAKATRLSRRIRLEIGAAELRLAF